jgi:hypothetical protein
MLQPHFTGDPNQQLTLENLQQGVPTVLGLARLCGAALVAIDPARVRWSELSPEAHALAFAARTRGVIEIRANKNAFDPVDRFLSICVPVGEDVRLVFRNREDARRTMAFFEGFRQLCAAGLVVHHLMFDFSLTDAGFRFADSIEAPTVSELLDFAAHEAI